MILSLLPSDYARLLRNVFSLSVLQALNYALPLVTIPFLLRTLGVESYGVLAFLNATITLFIIVIDYGFNLSATRRISICRHDLSKVSNIYSAVMTAKCLLILLCLLAAFILTLLTERYGEHQLLFFACFGVAVGHGLFPVWLYQGMEEMKYITYLNVLSKVTFTILIFLFVSSSEDIILVPIFTALGAIFVSFISLYIVKEKFGIYTVKPSFISMKNEFEEGAHIFFSNVSSSIYTTCAPIILGVYSSSTIVGYYSAAEKVIMAVRGLFSPISQAMYPFISRKVENNKQNTFTVLVYYTASSFLFMLLLSSCVYLFSDLISFIILGEESETVVKYLKIMSFLPLIVVLSNIVGLNVMLNYNMKKEFSFIILFGALTSLLLSFIFVPSFSGTGTASILVVTELVVLFLMAFTVWKRLYLEK
ncbi:flippase [Pseudoalteromonas sp. S2755]|uniref:flippase n=1 Tax=Pseudoalteromonas sp. S2755 TaxID=2066523 RepID=UPI00110AC777|nr:flippase [Pseudoalteromonas sp. S2755]TMN33195.1 flippase [Pseudoalteromonas sp. S2755]